MADAVADLTVDVWVELSHLNAADREALLSGRCKSCDSPRTVTVRLAKVFGYVSLDAVVLDEVDEESLGEAVCTDKSDTVGLAGAVERSFILDLSSANESGVHERLSL